MSQKKRIYVRPKDPSDPKAEGDLLAGLVAWGMECKSDYDQRQLAKKKASGGSTAVPPAIYAAAAKGK